MYEKLNREIKIFSVIGTILLICVVVYIIWMLKPTPPPKIQPLKKPMLDFSSVQSIQSERLVGDGICFGEYSPKNPSKAANQTLEWLKDAQPLSVKISKSHDNYVTSGCGLPYSSLHFQTNNGDQFDLFPAFYIWEKRSLFGHPTFEMRYVEDVIEVNEDGKPYFFRSKRLYNWLKSDGWKNDFDVNAKSLVSQTLEIND